VPFSFNQFSHGFFDVIGRITDIEH